MDADVQRFKDTWAEKVAAKEKVMVALGQALINDRDGKDSAAEWAIVEKQGYKNGIEGAKYAEARSLAESYVEAHKDNLTALLGERSLEDCVKFLDALRSAGLDQDVLVVEMWLMAKFEPQHIGGAALVTVRPDWKGA